MAHVVVKASSIWSSHIVVLQTTLKKCTYVRASVTGAVCPYSTNHILVSLHVVEVDVAVVLKLPNAKHGRGKLKAELCAGKDRQDSILPINNLENM